jgi:hypothetical protein
MTTIDDLFNQIQSARKRIGISKHPAWYRGHSNSEFHLLPSLLRHKIGLRHERNLMSIFMNEAAGLIPEKLQGSWDHLALMQHHGAPTRLLDWSESIDVALYFAIWNKCSSPVIWVLNPYRLNFESIGSNIIFDKADPVDYDYYREIKEHGNVPHEKPIAMQPPWVSRRVRRQKGCFTVHGSITNPIEEQNKKFVKSIAIPQHLVKDLRKYLKNKSFNDFELFPDLDGLSRSLIKRFRLDS